jgi:hydrogenase expression/formation protein HypD
MANVTITTFGDMLKVPGSRSSLQQEKADGADVRVVYSTMDALDIARENPQKSVILIGIGFETTAPTIAASILEAESQGIENYYVLCLNKLTPPVIKSLLNFKEVLLDGIVCPGHVSSIIGSHPYESIASDYGIACVVSGFEPLDILLCVDMLVGQIEDGEARVEIAYRRGVRPEGNKQAMKLMRRVFEVCPATWRGMGNLPESGLRLRREYQRFDVEQAFEIDLEDSFEPEGCLCGEILRGVKVPPDCKLFSRKCTLEHPVGPCMVSSEGSCSIYYRYVR